MVALARLYLVFLFTEHRLQAVCAGGESDCRPQGDGPLMTGSEVDMGLNVLQSRVENKKSNVVMKEGFDHVRREASLSAPPEVDSKIKIASEGLEDESNSKTGNASFAKAKDGQLESMRHNPVQALETEGERVKASGGFSFVSVRGESRKVLAVPTIKRPSESNQDCAELINALEDKSEVSDIVIVIKFICETDDMRTRVTELKNGCLYLPGNDQWQKFQDTVEHPNPWFFLDMMENSFIPREVGQKCPSEMSGLIANTTNGLEVEGCDVDGEPGLRSSAGGCIKTFTVAKTIRSNIHVRRAESLMALNPSWAELMERHGVGGLVKESLTEVMTLDKLQKLQQRGRALLSNQKSVEIPIKYFVCDAPGSKKISNAVTDQMLTDNTKAMNDGFAGKTTCQGPTQYHADREDSKISFKQVGITRLQHWSCRHDCSLSSTDMVAHIVPREMGMIKIVVCSTNLLGRASFPNSPDSERVLLITPGSVPGGSLPSYNLGATLTHEMGHYLGVYHTFQGGCHGGGDHVSDTSAQKLATEGCPRHKKSSCGSKDNIHNFMDYSFDSCMCSFTKGQVERIWGFMDSHMRDFLTTTNTQGISVKIVEAKNLQHKWWWETPDLYVEMKIVGRRASTAKTGTQNNEHHPKWHEYLKLPEYQKGDKLLFTVWEDDPIYDDEMGTAEIVPDCAGESNKVLTLSPQGSLTVKIRCGLIPKR